MITNIIDQSFADFASKVTTIEKKAVPQRQRLDLLADYYTDRVSANETELIQKYAASLVSGGQPHTPDPRLYMRRDLLGLVQDSYALGIADALVDLEDVQFSYNKTDADFALSPDDKLQRDIAKLQRDIQASQQIIRQTKTLNQYTNTLQTLQNQAQALGNTQATQTLGSLSQQLQTLKTNNTARTAIRVVNQQLQKGGTQQQQAQALVNQQIVATGSPNTQDYLVKRAIEEKLKYLQNRKDSLANTPSVVLDEDTDFFRWYADKRLVPIANRYQMQLEDRNNEAKDIVKEYTEKVGAGTVNQTARGAYTDKVVRKILNIEDESEEKYIKRAQQNAKLTGVYVDPFKREPLRTRAIKRVQRVVSTELGIAYNIGRLKAYMKADIQYVTISTSQYSSSPCAYCIDTEQKTEQQPISIASLLKRAYRNEGFDKSLNRPVENRYLLSHPYCFCYYKPHPKRDPEDKQDSTGVYADPNSWKFILGAGLGVSLVFLAFALTTGRKISVPTTIPVPQLRSKLPTVVSDTIPTTIPIQVVKSKGMPPVVANKNNALTTIPSIPRVDPRVIRSDLRDPLSLRMFLNDLSKTVRKLNLTTDQQEELTTGFNDIARNNQLEFVDKALEAQLLIAKITSPEQANDIVNKAVRKSGFIRELYFRKFDKIADKFLTIKPQTNIQKLENRIQSYVSPFEAKSITRTADNIEKRSINNQLQPISLLRSDLAESLKRVSKKANKKEGDLRYINDLKKRIADLDNFSTILEEQKQRLNLVKESIRVADKALIQQQIANTQALVDRLVVEPLLLVDAQSAYEQLLEMLVVLSKKDAAKYAKIQADLNRRIRNTQGLTLKRFMGSTVGFSKYLY